MTKLRIFVVETELIGEHGVFDEYEVLASEFEEARTKVLASIEKGNKGTALKERIRTISILSGVDLI
jgi:hypothetical protein